MTITPTLVCGSWEKRRWKKSNSVLEPKKIILMKICKAVLLYLIFYDVPQHKRRIRSSDRHHVSVVVQKPGARHLPTVNLFFVVFGFVKNARIPLQPRGKHLFSTFNLKNCKNMSFMRGFFFLLIWHAGVLNLMIQCLGAVGSGRAFWIESKYQKVYHKDYRKMQFLLLIK